MSLINHIILLICSLLDYWLGNKKRNELQNIHIWIPEDLDMVPLQSMPPLIVTTLEWDEGTSVPLVPLLIVENIFPTMIAN